MTVAAQLPRVEDSLRFMCGRRRRHEVAFALIEDLVEHGFHVTSVPITRDQDIGLVVWSVAGQRPNDDLQRRVSAQAWTVREVLGAVGCATMFAMVECELESRTIRDVAVTFGR